MISSLCPSFIKIASNVTELCSVESHKQTDKQTHRHNENSGHCWRPRTNSCEDKGKPAKTSIRYGMKLCHDSTCNRHGMSTHPRRVPTDPNLLICTTFVCAVYVALPCSNCRLCIPIGKWTAPLSTVGCSVSGLSTQACTPTERLAWQVITNCRR